MYLMIVDSSLHNSSSSKDLIIFLLLFVIALFLFLYPRKSKSAGHNNNNKDEKKQAAIVERGENGSNSINSNHHGNNNRHKASRSRKFGNKNFKTPFIISKAFSLPIKLSEEVGKIVDLSIRDFVMSWYHKEEDSKDEEVFLNDSRLLMIDILGDVCLRFERVNVPLLLMEDITPILRRSVHVYFESRNNNNNNNNKQTEEIELKLHPGAKNKSAMKHHFRKVARTILNNTMSDKDKACFALVTLLSEIIAVKVLIPIVDNLHPYYLNSLFISYMTREREKEEESKKETPIAQQRPIEPGKEMEVLDVGEQSVISDGVLQDFKIEEDYFKRPPSDAQFEILNTAIIATELSLEDERKKVFDSQPHVEFLIKVRASEAGELKEWIVWRRYSQFDFMAGKLRERYPNLKIKLPSKRGIAKVFGALGEFDKVGGFEMRLLLTIMECRIL